MPALVLFLAQLFFNLVLVKCANHQGTLTWEETCVSFRSVFLLSERLQYNVTATNLGGHLIYWIGSHLFWPPGLFYGRVVKAVVCSFFSPLIYLISIRFLEISKKPAFMAAFLCALLPGVFSFSWLATEYGLECSLGFLAIYLALRRTRLSEIAAALVTGFTAITYGAGICFVPVVVFIIGLNLVRASQSNRSRALMWGILDIFVALGVVVAPLFWWQNHPWILTGGGSVKFGELPGHLLMLTKELFYRSGSYYCFFTYPALSSVFVVILVGFGISIAIKERKMNWLWVGLGLCAIMGIYALSGREPGIRRGIPISIFSMFFVALALERLSISKRNWMFALCIVFAAVQFTKVSTRLWSGRIEIPMDLKFTPIPVHSSMEASYQNLLSHPDSAWDSKLYAPDSVLPTLYILSSRNPGFTHPVFDAARVRDGIHVEMIR